MSMPQQSSSSPDDQQQGKQIFDDAGVITISATPSLGERLLPVLFAAMETCWVAAILIALASVNTFGLREPLIALWAPFVLIIGTAWLLSYLERREITAIDAGATESAGNGVAGSRIIYGLLIVAALVIIWASVYATSFALFDLSWLGAMFSDLLLLNWGKFLHVMTVVGISVYFCRRGALLARRNVEPSMVMNMLRWGGVAIVLSLFLRALGQGRTYYELFFLLLIPLFLCIALIAHALAQATFMRRSHRGGLMGSVAAQEQALLTILGALGVALLLFGISIGSFASPAFISDVIKWMAPLGWLYARFVDIIAYVFVFLSTPIFWLLEALHFQTPFPQGPLISPMQPPDALPPSSVPPPAVVATANVLRVVLPLVIISLLVFSIWFLLRRRRLKLVRRNQDVHESIWSWSLFLEQLRALWLALWHRLFPRKALESAHVEKPLSGDPAARTIREIYRALLLWAASRGYARKKDETPYEFQQRLAQGIPLVEPELKTVTESYTIVRYGDVVPNESEVERVQGNWMSLQQKGQSL